MSFRRNMPQAVRHWAEEIGLLGLNFWGFHIVGVGTGTTQAFIPFFPFFECCTDKEWPVTRKR
jgi:hypothetical protein